MKKPIRTTKFLPGRHSIGVGAGALIINDQNEVLLMKRSSKTRLLKNIWAKPGGEVHSNETVVNSLKREVMEEIGCEIEVLELINHVDHIERKAKQHWVGFNFLCRITKGTPKNLEPEKCTELRWFSVDRLPKNCSKEFILEPVKWFVKKMKTKTLRTGFPIEGKSHTIDSNV